MNVWRVCNASLAAIMFYKKLLIVQIKFSFCDSCNPYLPLMSHETYISSHGTLFYMLLPHL